MPRGNCTLTHLFFDAKNYGDTNTRWSHNGILLFFNKAPIVYFGKSHNWLEASIFGSEFTATNHAGQIIEAVCYKFFMFGVPTNGPKNIFCDSVSVCTNTTWLESTLKKNHHSIDFHCIQESVNQGQSCFLNITRRPNWLVCSPILWGHQGGKTFWDFSINKKANWCMWFFYPSKVSHRMFYQMLVNMS